jgi:phosphoglycolate phosphatase-like HAD superfamily hydrolase
MADHGVRLVDFDGTLARIELPWEEARAEARRRGLPTGVRRALEADPGGAFWRWLDRFEVTATLHPLHPGLHDELAAAPFHWAIVTDNGGPVVARAVSEGVVPPPDAIVSRRWGRALKPDAAPLLEALAVLGVGRAGVTMIGDSAFDEHAALAAGLAFVPVERYQEVAAR